ncbi:hypothetical protein [Comamonas testosteroni]|jgi:hypothetical protein|uniref:hypothetical protein n=1 Tax=Comamonas testosteroni TaxID=285 RepID=UPI0026EB75E1|nr:hypothetical protein [Comamonas testosteroni]
MFPEQIQAKVGQQVSQNEMVDMLKSNPIGTSPNDVRVRGGVLSFSFGPDGVKLTGAEVRTPRKPTE